MAMKFLTRLRALLAVLFNRPLGVKLHGGSHGAAWFYPSDLAVLPAIEGGAEKEEEEEEKEGGEKEDKEPPKEEDEEGEKEDDDEKPEKTADDYRKELRRYERSSKRRDERQKTEIAELQKKLKEREDEDKSEREKELEKARKEARAEALTEAEKERRSDRLEVAATRHASKGVKVGEGDEAEMVKFADPEDAVIHVEKAIARGDVSAEDVFTEDNKVNSEALTEALVEILESKPHLRASNGKPNKPGDPDAGKGTGPGAEEDTSVEGQLGKIRKHGK